jgi:protein-disulfide isomerase
MWKRIALLLMFLLMASCARNASISKEDLATALKDNPEVLLEILEQNRTALADIVERGFKERVDQTRRAETEQFIRNPLEPSIDAGRPSLGSPDAPVTLVEYSDFFCQYCPQGTRTAKRFLSRHQDTVRLFYKHLPLSPPSRLAAAYFEAVAMQGHDSAWKFMDKVFAEQERFLKGGEPALAGLARDLGLDMDRLAADVRGRTVQERIEGDMQEAASFGIRGTPTFLLGGVPIRGAVPLEEFEQVLGMIAP